MLKNIAYKKFFIASLALIFAILIYTFPNINNKNIKPIIKCSNETVSLYALNNNNFLTLINILKPNNENEVNYIIDLLTINSITSSLLPLNFQGVIPQNTKLINYKKNDNILSFYFSKEFLSSNNINKIIEALTYTFINNKINGIKIFIEDNQLLVNPNNNEKLPNIITKNYGINKQYNITDTKNITKTTTYYISMINNEKYYIPITNITNNNLEKLEIIISEMKKTPIYEDNLISYLTAAYELNEYEIKNNEIILSFKNNLLYSLENKNIEEEITYTLSNSLMDTYNVENVFITFN